METALVNSPRLGDGPKRALTLEFLESIRDLFRIGVMTYDEWRMTYMKENAKISVKSFTCQSVLSAIRHFRFRG